MKMITVREVFWSVALLLLCLILSSPTSAQGIGGRAGVGGRGGIGGGVSSSFAPGFSGQAGTCAATGTACGTAITLSVTAGQFAVCSVFSFNPSDILTCTDSDGDSITNQPSGSPASLTFATFTSTFAVFEGALTHTNASEAFTCHHTVTANEAICAVSVYNGMPMSGFDVPLAANLVTGLASGATNASGGTTAVTANPKELAIGIFIGAGSGVTTWSAASGPWNLRTSNSAEFNIAIVDLTLTSTGAQTAAAIFNNSGTGASYIGFTTTIK